jgi:hypothetical protein
MQKGAAACANILGNDGFLGIFWFREKFPISSFNEPKSWVQETRKMGFIYNLKSSLLDDTIQSIYRITSIM